MVSASHAQWTQVAAASTVIVGALAASQFDVRMNSCGKVCAAVLVTAVTVAGCTGDAQNAAQAPITQIAAKVLADSYALQAVSVIDPKPAADLDATMSPTTPCDGAVPGMATVRRVYRLTGYPTDSYDLAGARVRDLWKSKGYTVDVKNLGGDEPNIVATHRRLPVGFHRGNPPVHDRRCGVSLRPPRGCFQSLRQWLMGSYWR